MATIWQTFHLASIDHLTPDVYNVRIPFLQPRFALSDAVVLIVYMEMMHIFDFLVSKLDYVCEENVVCMWVQSGIAAM